MNSDALGKKLSILDEILRKWEVLWEWTVLRERLSDDYPRVPPCHSSTGGVSALNSS